MKKCSTYIYYGQWVLLTSSSSYNLGPVCLRSGFKHCSLLAYCANGQWVESASNRNEYLAYLLGVKAAGA